jgi:hypothetical protein
VASDLYRKGYGRDILLKGLTQNLQPVAARRPCIQNEDAMVRPRHLAWQRYLAAADQPRIRDGVMGARHGRVVTTVVRAPVRPATRCIRVVSRASARRIAGNIVVSRRASIDVPTPGDPKRRTLGSECLHRFYLHT